LTSTHSRRTLPALETLEDRCTPAVSLFGGTIMIFGTASHDTVTVNPYTAYDNQQFYRVTDNGVDHYFTANSVTGSVWFSGGNGNDYFDNNTDLDSVAYGGWGNDTLNGGSGDDHLEGGYNSDILSGGEGNDYLDAGAGTDYAWNVLHGGGGNDTLHGSEGPDVLSGEAGVDLLYGHGDTDHLDGGNDNVLDVLFGGTGADVLEVEWNFNAGYFQIVDIAADATGADTVNVNI
jgi:Ca2+-binding RTX toxin-like protein